MENHNEMPEAIYNIRNRKNNHTMIINEKNMDSIVFNVLQEFQKRAEIGYTKYGKDMDRDDLTFIEWIQHAKEEHMDAILYLEKIRQEEICRLDRTRSQKEIITLKMDLIFTYVLCVFMIYILNAIIYGLYMRSI